MRPEKNNNSAFKLSSSCHYFIINPLHTKHVLSAKVIHIALKLLPLSQQALIDGQRATNVTESSVLFESEFNGGLEQKSS